MKNYSDLLARVNGRCKASEIRELLKLTNQPDIISFAGGLPDPFIFPVREITEISCEVMNKDARTALQYGQTEGEPAFIDEVIKLLKSDENIEITRDEILITSASQQSLDLVSKTFINEGDCVIVGKPTYLGALQAFNAYGAAMTGAQSDSYGIIPRSLEEKLAGLKENGKRCKFVYIVPDFQNPTGTTIPQERRVEILEIAKKYSALILEDSPYRKIRFSGKHQKTFFALDKGEGNVFTMFTFSKVFVPGFRLGYIIGNKDVMRKMVILKQSMDLCSSPICQLITKEYLKQGKLAPHIEKVVRIYSKKRDAMLKALKTYMPEGVSWTEPEGGLFLWLVLPEGIDAAVLLKTALANGVAYVTGSAFYHDNSGRNTMRLNFSYASFEQIDEGIKRLAKAIVNFGLNMQ
jgi:2-aminoadipate transaminase